VAGTEERGEGVNARKIVGAVLMSVLPIVMYGPEVWSNGWRALIPVAVLLVVVGSFMVGSYLVIFDRRPAPKRPTTPEVLEQVIKEMKGRP